MRDVKLSDAPGVCEGPSDSLSVDLLVEVHMLEGKFIELLVLLNALQDLLEANDVFEGVTAEAQRLQNVLVLHELSECDGGFA